MQDLSSQGQSTVPKTIEDILHLDSNLQEAGPLIAKVTLKSELFEDSNRTCFYFAIRDNTSISVNVHSFDALAQELHRQIQIGQTYFITNFHVVKKELLDTEFHLTSHSIIRPCMLPNKYAPIPIQRKFLSNIIQNGKKGEYFNVLVALHSIKTPLHDYEYNDGTKCKRIDLFVRDESDCIVTLILWRSHAENYAQNAKGSNPILFLKQVQLFNVKGYLTSKQSTQLDANPKFKEALALKSWIMAQNHLTFGFDRSADVEPKVGQKRKRQEEQESWTSDSNSDESNSELLIKCKRLHVDLTDHETNCSNNDQNTSVKENESPRRTSKANFLSSLLILAVMASLLVTNIPK